MYMVKAGFRNIFEHESCDSAGYIHTVGLFIMRVIIETDNRALEGKEGLLH